MKKIEAIIRPECLAKVRTSILELGISGLTILDALGLGGQKGYTEIYRGKEYKIPFLKRVKVEVFVSDALASACVQAIMDNGRTGRIGDGKIVVTAIDELFSIRTGESETGEEQ